MISTVEGMGPHSRAAPVLSVFVGKHDRENARGLLNLARRRNSCELVTSVDAQWNSCPKRRQGLG
jgi:hypothetical protein